MKIAIPVNEKSIEEKISDNFGRPNYYLIYNSESQEEKYVDNTAAQLSSGAGVKAAQILVDQKPDVLLTPRMGENAAIVVKTADIEIYKSLDRSARENIEAYLNGELEILQEIHSGHHGQGGK